MLGMFSPEEYTHFKPGKAFFLLGCFLATLGGLLGVVSMYYPDKPSAPRTFPGGLEAELGGPNALSVRSGVDVFHEHSVSLLTRTQARKDEEGV